MPHTVGILGGMGPMATVDFITKVINLTPAERDQDHIPLIIHSVPQIPDRTEFILNKGKSPADALEKGLKTLINAGATCIAIPCNTAHYWHKSLDRISPIPILHIAKSCAEILKEEEINTVGLLATDGTLKAGFYLKEFESHGINIMIPNPSFQKRVMKGIYLVKSGKIDEGGKILEDCTEEFIQSGVQKIILGCTEIPLALEQTKSKNITHCLDATQALALSCVQWFKSQDNQLIKQNQL